jgi:hypothetical protein
MCKEYKKKTNPHSITMEDTYAYILFMNVVQWFVKLYYRLVKKINIVEYKPSILKTESIQYCDNARTKFLAISSREDKNSNIDTLFYDKEQYTK